MLASLACASAVAGYGMDDFARVEKIDAHVHIHGTASRFLEQAALDHFRVLTINVDAPDFPPIARQMADAVALRAAYPGRVAFAGTNSVNGFSVPGWESRAQRQIDEALAQGAVAIKFWKNIGMELRDAQGRLVMIDDDRFRPLFERLESDGVVVLGHQAEPRNCWLPFEQMTVEGDREYFQEHPQYHMYGRKDMPSHEEQIAARDRMLAAYPGLRFVGLHLASLEWDVDEVGRFLDRYPNAAVDLAARMPHLQRQAAEHPEKVRAFFLRYQDRILYGTDITYDYGSQDEAVAREAHAAWKEDWRFLNTKEQMHSSEFEAAFHGLGLPREVVDKIYETNARRLFPGAWN